MEVAKVDFDDLLRRLEEARIVDDEIHNRKSTLTERAASRDALMEVRAEMATFRARVGTPQSDGSIQRNL